MRDEHATDAEDPMPRVLRGDEVVHLAAAESDAIDLRVGRQSGADCDDRAGIAGSVARDGGGKAAPPP